MMHWHKDAFSTAWGSSAIDEVWCRLRFVATDCDKTSATSGVALLPMTGQEDKSDGRTLRCHKGTVDMNRQAKTILQKQIDRPNQRHSRQLRATGILKCMT